MRQEKPSASSRRAKAEKSFVQFRCQVDSESTTKSEKTSLRGIRDPPRKETNITLTESGDSGRGGEGTAEDALITIVAKKGGGGKSMDEERFHLG